MTSPAFDFASAAPATSPLGGGMPCNIEAEQALLGALLYDNAVYERLIDKLQAPHFFEPFHQRLFQVMEEHIRRGQLADPILVADRFKQDAAFTEFGGLRYLADLVDRAPPAVNAPDYARIIYDLALRRDLIRIGGEIAFNAAAEADQPARDQIERAEQQLYTLAETGGVSSGFVTFSNALHGAVEMAAEAYSRDGGLAGVSTGLMDLDRQLGGLHPSDLLILAGRPSMGKAQPLSAKVLKRDGSWCEMAKLRLGDELASVDGAPSRICGLYPQGERDVYLVRFADGRATECCDEHLWSVNSEEWAEPQILSTAAIAALLPSRRHRRRLWIDRQSGHFGDRAPLPVDPWVLGRLLGSGALLEDCALSLVAAAEATSCGGLARRSGSGPARRAGGGAETLRPVDRPGPARTPGTGSGTDPGNAFDLLKAGLETLGLLGLQGAETFLPACYLSADRETRFELLEGLLRGGGEDAGPVRFSTYSPHLAADAVALVRSLGGLASCKAVSPSSVCEGEPPARARRFIVRVRGLEAADLSRLTRGAARSHRTAGPRRLTFVSIDRVRRAPVQCVAVTHKARLYVTDGYIVTHNTALATNIAFHVARSYAYDIQPDGSKKTANGGVVAFFSLEMSAEQLAMRLLAEVSGVSSDRLRKGEIDQSEFARVRDAALEIQESPLFIDATGGLSIAKLAARARRLKRSSGLDLIVVDYLQLVTGSDLKSNDNRVQEVSQITQGLKALAKELSVPILALSQLSRQVENREDKKPQLSDLRESGSIEQDADAVMFVYRESYYLGRKEPREGTPEHLTWQEEMDKVQGLAEVIVGKQRHGPIGTVRLHFNADLTKFGNLAREGRYDPR